VHPNHIDLVNVVGRQLPHRSHVRSIPACFPLVQNGLNLQACVVVD
jgi:hypothetical protein